MPITALTPGTFVEGTTTNQTFPYPAGLVANDVLVFIFGVNVATVPSTQTGFTTVLAISSTGNTLVPSYYMGIKFATGAESGSFTSTIAGVTARSGQIHAYRGVDTSSLAVGGAQDVAASPMDKTNTTTATLDIPGVTTSRTDCALIYGTIQNAATGAMSPPTAPGTFLEDCDRVSGRNFSTGHLVWSGSGATGTINVTGNGNSRAVGGLLILRPAAGAAVLPPKNVHSYNPALARSYTW